MGSCSGKKNYVENEFKKSKIVLSIQEAFETELGIVSIQHIGLVDQTVLEQDCSISFENNKILIGKKVTKEGNLELMNIQNHIMVLSDGKSKGLEYWKLEYLDLVKLGRIQFQVISGLKRQLSEKISQDSEECCRFCQMSEQSEENALLKICQCQGSLSYIHIQCLQQWQETKIKIIKNKMITFYYWKDLRCEICKGQIESCFVQNNIAYPLIKLGKQNKKELYLNLQGRDKDQIKGILNIDFEQSDTIKIGKLIYCDISFNDETLNKMHSIIYQEKGDFYIKDCGSKYGTLIQGNKQKTIRLDGTMRINYEKQKQAQKESFVMMPKIEQPKYYSQIIAPSPSYKQKHFLKQNTNL